MAHFRELPEDSGRESWENPIAEGLSAGKEVLFSLDTLEEDRAIMVWNRHFQSLSVLTVPNLEEAYEKALGAAKKRWFIYRLDGPFVFELTVAGERMIRIKIQRIFYNSDVCVKVEWLH